MLSPTSTAPVAPVCNIYIYMYSLSSFYILYTTYVISIIYIIYYNLCRTSSAPIDPVWLIHVVSTAPVAPVCIIYTIYYINLYCWESPASLSLRLRGFNNWMLFELNLPRFRLCFLKIVHVKGKLNLVFCKSRNRAHFWLMRFPKSCRVRKKSRELGHHKEI